MSTDETTRVTVCPASELEAGGRLIFEHEGEPIAVFNADGELFAIEDRCSHDDGPLAEGEWSPADCTVECPRHGSLFDLRTGKPKTLPAFQPVRTFPVEIIDDNITLEV
jgi:3-phenylpropionate/trans-cinnamate dioxygenase ferredoxin component